MVIIHSGKYSILSLCRLVQLHAGDRYGLFRELKIILYCPSRGPNPRIQAGMVLAIEPMINLADHTEVLTDLNYNGNAYKGKF